MAAKEYLLDTGAPQAEARFAALAALYDPGSIRHLESCGVAAGWRCLEIGAGGGSIARWLADRVGETGRVVATDLDTRYLAAMPHPRIEVREHDVTAPLPDGEFDLIHARLVLNSVPNAEAVLHRLIQSLAPGGWLAVEEFDSESTPPDPANHPAEVYLATHQAVAGLMRQSGFDRRYGRRLFQQFRSGGLHDVAAEARMLMCEGGSAGARLLQANCEQLRDRLISEGHVTPAQFDDDMDTLADPQVLLPSSVMWSVRGRRS